MTINRAVRGRPFDSVRPEHVVRQAHRTIVNIPFALSLSKGKRYVVLRTGLSSHMLSAGGILAQLIYAQTIRVGSVCRSLFKNILSL